MAERVGAVLDEGGNIVDLIVLPPTDAELGPAWSAAARSRVRELSADERRRGVGIGWKRSATGRWTDERPAPPVDPTPPVGPTPPAPR